jgi:hypothetical protein
MAFHRPQRDDITIHGIGGDGDFGLRWHRLLLPMVGMPSVHLGPIAFGTPALAMTGHTEPTAPAPIDESSPLPPEQELGSLVPAPHAADGAPTPAPQGADAAGATGLSGFFWHPPYFADSPLTDESASAPGDSGSSDPAGDHGPAADAGGGNLVAAFLPADATDTDLPHGLELGFLFTPPPLVPPPDGI